MDKIIERPTGWKAAFTRKALPWWLGAALACLVIFLLVKPSHSTLRVSGDTISVSEVKAGEFNDYIRLSGTVQPLVTIQISPIEGGIVDAILIEEGSQVKKGDEILRLSNDNLDLQILNSEAELAEKENILRNTQIQMEQDSLFRSTQVERMRESLENMQINMRMIRKRKDNLTIKAPIDGQLGILDAVLGENIAAGTKIGQISDMSSYKIEAQIDEHYIDRVTPGLAATFERQSATFNASLRKVYPEVRDGKFKADFKFEGEVPENIRSGQTYYLNLQLGSPEGAVLIPRGSFFQKTGGKWIYVVSKDGSKAMKREIRIGRQNPQYYEVLEGLEPGEKVITSGYDSFGENEVLILQ